MQGLGFKSWRPQKKKSCVIVSLQRPQNLLYCGRQWKIIYGKKGLQQPTLLEKAKLAREISDGKNEIPHKFFGHKI